MVSEADFSAPKTCKLCGAVFTRRQREREGRLRYTESVQEYAVRLFCSRHCAKKSFRNQTMLRSTPPHQISDEVLALIRAPYVESDQT